MKKNLLILSLVGCVLASQSAEAGWEDYLPWSKEDASSRGARSTANGHQMRSSSEEEWVVISITDDVEREATTAQLAHEAELAKIRQAFLAYQAAVRAEEPEAEKGVAPVVRQHEEPAAASASTATSPSPTLERTEPMEVTTSTSAPAMPAAAVADQEQPSSEEETPPYTPKVWTAAERAELRKLREEMTAWRQNVRYEYEIPAPTKLSSAEQYTQYLAHQGAVYGPARR